MPQKSKSVTDAAGRAFQRTNQTWLKENLEMQTTFTKVIF
jgi:hypothetical protein